MSAARRMEISLGFLRKASAPLEFIQATKDLPASAVVVLRTFEPPAILVDDEDNYVCFAEDGTYPDGEYTPKSAIGLMTGVTK